MSTTTPLIGDQLGELLALVEHADSVELKLTVPESGHRSAIAALELDPLAAQIRQVYFFDTPELALNQAGVVARARRMQGKGDDSVVKLRPVVPDALPEDLRTSAAFVVEVDAMPSGFVCSGTLKARPTPSPVWDVTHGNTPISRLFNKHQRGFFEEHAPEGVTLDALSVLGPIFVLKLAFTRPEYARGRVVAELWLYPDGSRILELSTKCAPADTIATALEARKFLEGRGVQLGGEQQTKTRTALEFFATELAATG